MFSFGRLEALLTKEFIQMRRDRITFAMMLGVPLMQLVLFGFAINNDPKSLPAALVTTSNDRFTRAMVSALQVTQYYRFDHVVVEQRGEAERLMASGEVPFVVTIPSDFARRVERARQSDNADRGRRHRPVGRRAAPSRRCRRSPHRRCSASKACRPTADETARSQLQVVVHRRYNPEGISQYNIVPGLLGVILQMTMVMMTSMALTRETERGTMENLLAMPASPAEIMLGKILPYLGRRRRAGGGGADRRRNSCFRVPFVGSLPLLFSAVLAFVLSLVLLGYTISTVARTQMQAMQLTFFFFLPSLLLSGFMFPYRGMPDWAQTLGEIFPLTHFLRIMRAVMLKGADFQAIAGEIWALVIFIFLFAGLALFRFRRTLD